MRLLERPAPVLSAGNNVPRQLGLRANGQVMELPCGKTTIGSGARCSLRIEAPGVQPLHCLVISSAEGLSVCRWAPDATLNGEPFKEARLSVGDRLVIGTAKLEIVDLQHHSAEWKPVETPLATQVDELRRLCAIAADDAAVAGGVAPAGATNAASIPPPAPQGVIPIGSLTRARRRKLLGILRRGRDTLHDLLQRVEGLESVCRRWKQQHDTLSEQCGTLEARLASQEQQLEAIRQGSAAELPDYELGGGHALTEAEATVAKERPELTDGRAESSSGPDDLAYTDISEDNRHDEPVHDLTIQASSPTGPPAAAASVTGASDAHSRAGETESFIERYGRLLADDESCAAAEAPIGDEPAAVEPLAPTADAAGASSAASESGTASSDAEEESIEQYMAKLLDRVRGESSQPVRSQPHASAAVATPQQHERQRPVPPTDATPAADIPTSPSPSLAAQDAPLPSLFGTVGRLMPLSPPGAASELESLRALANETARRAISTHALRKLRRNATTKVIVAMLAGMTSLWLMLQSPDWRDWQFITACVSMLVATYWAGQAYRTLVALWDEAIEDAADQQADELADAPLPIDLDEGQLAR